MAHNTTNFKVDEFKCKHCGVNQVQQSVIDLAQKIRTKLGNPISINSGYRCVTHNKAVGGVSNSQHVKGTAADLSSPSGALQIYLAVHDLWLHGEIPELGYCSLYPRKNFVHVDTGPKRGGIFTMTL